MKARHVYLANDLPAARQAMSIARSAGIADSDIGLIARGDIEEFKIHDRRKEADSDLIPALKRGLLLGAAAGIVVAVLMGLTWDVGASWPMIVLGGAVGGAMVGGLGSMLAGASIPDPIRQKYAKEIESGKILVIVDGERDGLIRLATQMDAHGVRQLAYEALSGAT